MSVGDTCAWSPTVPMVLVIVWGVPLTSTAFAPIVVTVVLFKTTVIASLRFNASNNLL